MEVKAMSNGLVESAPNLIKNGSFNVGSSVPLAFKDGQGLVYLPDSARDSIPYWGANGITWMIDDNVRGFHSPTGSGGYFVDLTGQNAAGAPQQPDGSYWYGSVASAPFPTVVGDSYVVSLLIGTFEGRDASTGFSDAGAPVAVQVIAGDLRPGDPNGFLKQESAPHPLSVWVPLTTIFRATESSTVLTLVGCNTPGQVPLGRQAHNYIGITGVTVTDQSYWAGVEGVNAVTTEVFTGHVGLGRTPGRRPVTSDPRRARVTQ